MRMYDIILKKRKGQELSAEEIRFVINGFTKGEIPDYQMSALLMAICFNSMSDLETAKMTYAMADSGDKVDLSEFGSLSVDKHSTGGVGDKTTLIITPIVASCGAKIAKMSGRGLGYTGGTVDKLEAITGYRTGLSEEEFFSQVRTVGASVIGQTGNLAPADKKIYSLRDVTATVDSIPLIASSIMSKKLASGAKSIVLDVKTGSGAFMSDIDSAKELASRMVAIGRHCGRNISALITNMDIPLGTSVGNALEVIEAVKVLKCEEKGELRELCLELSAQMLTMSLGISHDEAHLKAEKSLDGGMAYEKLKEWVAAQGGDIRMLDDTSLFPKAAHTLQVISPSSGYICRMNTAEIGRASSILGAGRAKKEDKIDLSAGIVIAAKTGDRVNKGDTIAILYSNSESSLQEARKIYNDALEYSELYVQKHDTIICKVN